MAEVGIVVIASHSMDTLREMCHGVVLNHGAVHFDGPIHNASTATKNCRGRRDIGPTRQCSMIERRDSNSVPLRGNNRVADRGRNEKGQRNKNVRRTTALRVR